MPRPDNSLILPPLTLPPNEMASSPKIISPKEHSSLADLIQAPFLARSPETRNSNKLHDRLGGCETEQRISRRFLSEGVLHPGAMHVISHGGSQLGSAGWLKTKKGDHVVSSSDHRVPTLSNELQIHFDQSCGPKAPTLNYCTDATVFSSQFPQGHHLNADFVKAYQLQDELGTGGYGFVMTAYDRIERQEVAVKFIIKEKVPEHGWMEDEAYGRLPTEVVLLSCVNHENIVKCLGLFEDNLFFYLVQELHGSPWQLDCAYSMAEKSSASTSSSTFLPVLSPSSSEASLPVSEPSTPPKVFVPLRSHSVGGECLDEAMSKLLDTHLSLDSPTTRPEITRRPSYDLFECIEQSENKRLTENQARYVFSQVVDAVEYLDRLGIAHRDIKDENLVIDKSLKIKLIDFGSAIVVDPSLPRPIYDVFYGTAAYASSEILLKEGYYAAPAEIWTLGVLLSYLLAGISPFPNLRDAIDGRIFLPDGDISNEAMDLMRKCLDSNPASRATISQVKEHPWLQVRQ